MERTAQLTQDLDTLRSHSCTCMSAGHAIEGSDALGRVRLAVSEREQLLNALRELVECDPDTAMGRGMPVARRNERFAAARAILANAKR